MIKLLHWEYWPFEVIYAIPFLYWVYLSARAGSFFFFRAANPAIPNGGMFGESKFDILNKIPQNYIPKTVYASTDQSFEHLQQELQTAGIDYPVIAKPNIGSRGFLVKKVQDRTELEAYLKNQSVDFLLQEYVDYPMEVSVMYYRFPDQAQGAISSVTLKEYLTVTGDGTRTVQQLVQNYDRAKLQLDTLKQSHAHVLSTIPAAGERLELVPIGNHCKGAAFFNGNKYIDQELVDTFDELSHQIKGIYFGRFDLKCSDLQTLKKGEHFKILEINGVGAEPAHIYDPGYSFWKALGDIMRQWKIIYQISVANRRKGAPYMTYTEMYHTLSDLFAYKKLARS